MRSYKIYDSTAGSASPVAGLDNTDFSSVSVAFISTTGSVFSEGFSPRFELPDFLDESGLF